LGRLVGPSRHRHPDQAEFCKVKAKQAAKFLGWLGLHSAEASLDVAEMMCRYLVNSVIVSAVLNTHLRERDLNVLRIPQVQVARKVSWAGQRVSQLPLLRELNWEPIEAVIWYAKLCLQETLKCLPAGSYGRTVLDARMRSVQQGKESRGLCAEMNVLWDSSGRHGWNETVKESKSQRKKRLKPIVEASVDRLWQEWVRDNSSTNADYALLCPPKGEQAEHLSNGCKKRVALMITMRMGGCTFKGNKCHDRKGSRMCDCGLSEEEDGCHVLLECRHYILWRAIMMEKLERLWTTRQRQQFEKTGRRYKKLLLLGRSFDERMDDPSKRKAQDTIVKDFLFAINDHRKKSLGLPDMCGVATAPPECSVAEAQLWLGEVQEAVEDMEVWDDDD
jgi:hypothetical protein